MLFERNNLLRIKLINTNQKNKEMIAISKLMLYGVRSYYRLSKTKLI